MDITIVLDDKGKVDPKKVQKNVDRLVRLMSKYQLELTYLQDLLKSTK